MNLSQKSFILLMFLACSLAIFSCEKSSESFDDSEITIAEPNQFSEFTSDDILSGMDLSNVRFGLDDLKDRKIFFKSDDLSIRETQLVDVLTEVSGIDDDGFGFSFDVSMQKDYFELLNIAPLDNNKGAIAKKGCPEGQVHVATCRSEKCATDTISALGGAMKTGDIFSVKRNTLSVNICANKELKERIEK